MGDAEAVVKLMRHRVERCVAGMAARHHQMAGQRCLGRAHAPDVQIVQCGHPSQRREMRAHGIGIKPFRHRVEGEADRAFQQSPTADDDDHRDREADRRVEPQPPGQPNHDPGGDDSGGDQRIGGHMDKGAFDVEVACSARSEKQRRPAVDHDPDRRDPDHDPTRDRNRIGKAQHRLPGDAAGDHQQNDGVGECGEDRARAQPIGEPAARLALAQHCRAPGQGEAEHVTEVVPGIGEQRQ
jgi:hypothetical protein